MSEHGVTAGSDEDRRALEILSFEGGAEDGRRLGPGDRVGDFEIREEIGCGGTGIVYRARQLSLGREVALKLVPEVPDGDASEGRAHRREREARLLGALRHEGIVGVHGAGRLPGFRWVAMDLVAGGSLRDVVSGRAEGWPRLGDEGYFAAALDLLRRVADALATAHSHGVVHRDVKPENVLFDERRRPVLVDFGLAREDESTGLTITRGFVGTPRYASPEQARGEPLGPASDVFSFGLVAFETLTGRPAFSGGTAGRVLEEIQRAEPAWPARPKIPRDVRAVVERCLEKRPRRRYADGRSVEAEISRILRFEPVEAVPAGPIRRLLRRLARRPGAAPAAVLTASLFLCAGLGATLLLRESANVARAEAAGRMIEARRLRFSGDLERAEGILAEVAAAQETPAGACGLLADLSLRRGDAGRAAVLYRRERESSGGEPADRIGEWIAAAALRGEKIPPPLPAPETLVSARDHGLMAALLELRGEREESIAHLDAAVAMEPSAFLWHVDRALLNFALRRFSRAISDYRAARERPSFDHESLRRLGWALSGLGRPEEHASLLDAALAATPDDARLIIDRSSLFRQSGLPDAANAARRRALEIAADDPIVIGGEALHLAHDRQFDAARAILARGLESRPGLTFLLYRKAVVEMEAGEEEIAETIARPLVDEPYIGADALAIVAKARMRTGRTAEAEESYRRLREIDPENPAWGTQHGHLLLGQDRFEEAERAFRESLELAPLEPRALFGLGHVLRRTGRPWDALVVYDRALAVEPSRGETQYWLGDLWMELGVPGAARRYFARTVEGYPTWFDAWAMKGAAEAADGDLESAEATYRRALEIHPGHAPVMADFAEVLDRMGRDAESLDLYRAARAIDPSLPTAWCGEGLLRLRSDDPRVRDRDAAVGLLERAVSLRPDDAAYRGFLEEARSR